MLVKFNKVTVALLVCKVMALEDVGTSLVSCSALERSSEETTIGLRDAIFFFLPEACLMPLEPVPEEELQI
jgi:hypothetical protein